MMPYPLNPTIDDLLIWMTNNILEKKKIEKDLEQKICKKEILESPLFEYTEKIIYPEGKIYYSKGKTYYSQELATYFIWFKTFNNILKENEKIKEIILAKEFFKKHTPFLNSQK